MIENPYCLTCGTVWTQCICLKPDGGSDQHIVRRVSCDCCGQVVAGASVEICDGSEAHGDKGRVMQVQDDGLIIVELEAGCVWPVTKNELKLSPPVRHKATTP